MKNKTFILTLAGVLILGAGAYFWLQQYSVSEDMVESEIREESSEEVISEEDVIESVDEQLSEEDVIESVDEQFVQPPSGDSAKVVWEDYSNEEYGFRLKFPRRLLEHSEPSIETYDNITRMAFSGSFSLTLLENPDQLSLSDWSQQWGECRRVKFEYGGMKQRAIHDGIVILEHVSWPKEYFEVGGCGPDNATVIMPPHKEYVIDFSISDDVTELAAMGFDWREGFEQLHEDILESFKFFEASEETINE